MGAYVSLECTPESVCPLELSNTASAIWHWDTAAVVGINLQAASVGYDDVKTIVVLGSESALQKAKGNRSLVGADLDVIVGKDSAVVQSDVSETQLIPYSMADGALIDLSVKGRLALCLTT